MKLIIIESRDFFFLNNKTLNDINGKECQVSLKGKNITFSIKDQDYAILTSGECLFKREKNELTFFKVVNESIVLIFKLQGEANFDKEMKRWLRKRNGSVLFRSPLTCEYSTQD